MDDLRLGQDIEPERCFGPLGDNHLVGGRRQNRQARNNGRDLRVGQGGYSQASRHGLATGKPVQPSPLEVALRQNGRPGRFRPGNGQQKEPARQQGVDPAADIRHRLAGVHLTGRRLAIDREEIRPEDHMVGRDRPGRHGDPRWYH